jgi:predicted TIM-barrel fold metal-dependent hydrolase
MDFGIIDCDFHPSVADAGALDEYLTSAQRDRLAYLGVGGGLPQLNYRAPGRAQHFAEPTRADCIPPGGGPPASDLDFVRSHYLDPHGIAASVLIPLQPAAVDFWTYPDEAAWWVSAFNDYFYDHWIAEEPRFNLNMVVSPHDPELAVKEIHRMGPKPGVVAVFLPMIDRMFGHRSFYPIYEAAQEHDLAIMVHPMSSDDFHGTATRAGGQPNHYTERYITLNEFAMSHLTSLVFEGVFERYPRLKFMFVEFGWTWVASLLWRMDAVYKAGRRHHPWMTKSPTEYVHSHVRFTSEPMLECPPNWVSAQLEMMEASKTLLYSSDYPHWDSEEPWVAFKGIDEGLQRQLFRDNALEFLGGRLRVTEPATMLGA